MSYLASGQPGRPDPKELVAYVDGRLDALSRRRVEQWLAVHPEAAAAVEEHRQVVQAFSTAALAEPGEAEWAAVLARVEAAVEGTKSVQAHPRGKRRWAAWLTGAAAALLLALTPGDLSPLRTPLDLLQPDTAPFDIASADEVEIVSIDAADLRFLLVGHPPLRGPLVLAAGGDVELVYAEAGRSGWVRAMPDDESATPMYIVPMRTELDDQP